MSHWWPHTARPPFPDVSAAVASVPGLYTEALEGPRSQPRPWRRWQQSCAQRSACQARPGWLPLEVLLGSEEALLVFLSLLLPAPGWRWPLAEALRVLAVLLRARSPSVWWFRFSCLWTTAPWLSEGETRKCKYQRLLPFISPGNKQQWRKPTALENTAFYLGCLHGQKFLSLISHIWLGV